MARAGSALELSRAQVLAFRRRVSALDERLPMRSASLRRAAWAGLQDSMPRAALLSIHARVSGATPWSWEDASLVQVWGPRFSAYVVAGEDVPLFTLGRLPDDPGKRRFAADLAGRLEAHLAGARIAYGPAARALGIHPNALRYAAPTGRVLIRWEGARQPVVWTVPPPDVEPFEARLELARRYLHVFGPATADSFSDWAGIKLPRGEAAFDALAGWLLPVRTSIGEAWILAADESLIRAAARPAAAARLLPSGDTFFLLWGRNRELLVPDPGHRARLWTSRVWPGSLLVGGEVAGTWRRADAVVSIQPWRRLSALERQAVEAEVASMPIRGFVGRMVSRWDG